MRKKGQVALYLIIGLIILAIVMVVFYFKGEFFKSLFEKSAEESVLVPPQLMVVKNHIDNCFETTSNEGLLTIGNNGGYYKVPTDKSIIWFADSVPYYYLNRENLVPSIKIIEKEYSSYIKDNIKSCLNFTEFVKIGYSISSKSPLISTKINNKTVDIIMEYPITIKKLQTSVSLRYFKLRINSNVAALQKASGDLVDSYSKKPGYVCLNCLEKISAKNNVSIDALPHQDPTIFENDIVWFLIDDTGYELNNKTLTLRFVVEQ
ncbi:hypothetical protein J4230_02735 [Candidatus Woesearchaeota archaeon]|nr:hypothetical protein [Candidatus Woesearchaeota archaeon]